MRPIGENATLATDLDCRFFDLHNVLHFYPVPLNLVQITDPRLRDERELLPGSVIDESVANDAAILQGKLNLNGLFPTEWFQPSPDIDAPLPLRYAAKGDLAEMLARKGVPNGYAPIDLNRRLLPANVTPGAGPGTVSDVMFSFPAEFDVTVVSGGSTLSSSVTWKAAPNNSWFGLYGGATPKFHEEQIPDPFFPQLAASKFTTGLFDPEVLPVAKGVGEDHAPGIVPDPGLQGDPDEYLGRDMDWHHFESGPPYQPKVQQPSITLISVEGDRNTVTIRTDIPGAILFYRAGRPSFRECPSEFTLQLPPGMLVEAYAAKEGYNNSTIASYTVPPPDIIDIITEE